MLIFQWFANSRIVREFPPFSFKVRIATLTRNQVSYAECQTAETLGTMRVPAEFKLNNVACSILLFFPISTG